MIPFDAIGSFRPVAQLKEDLLRLEGDAAELRPFIRQRVEDTVMH
jgi:hypothetical protein